MSEARFVLIVPLMVAFFFSVAYESPNYCAEDNNASRAAKPVDLCYALNIVEECAITLKEYGREVIKADVEYIGVLGRLNRPNSRNGITDTGCFLFRGHQQRWGNSFWWCRIISKPTGSKKEFSIKIKEDVIWFSAEKAGRDFDEIDIGDIKDKNGKELLAEMLAVSYYERRALE